MVSSQKRLLGLRGSAFGRSTIFSLPAYYMPQREQENRGVLITLSSSGIGHWRGAAPGAERREPVGKQKFVSLSLMFILSPTFLFYLL
jgi:hypothetical protein